MQAIRTRRRSRWTALAVYGVFGATAFATGYSVVRSAEAGNVPPPSPAPSATVPKPQLQPNLQQQRLAHEAFRSRRWAQAYGRYAELADAGDAAAASLALMMVDQGPVLFGSEWSAAPGQLQRWGELAARRAEQRRAQIAEHDRGE